MSSTCRQRRMRHEHRRVYTGWALTFLLRACKVTPSSRTPLEYESATAFRFQAGVRAEGLKSVVVCDRKYVSLRTTSTSLSRTVRSAFGGDEFPSLSLVLLFSVLLPAALLGGTGSGPLAKIGGLVTQFLAALSRLGKAKGKHIAQKVRERSDIELPDFDKAVRQEKSIAEAKPMQRAPVHSFRSALEITTILRSLRSEIFGGAPEERIVQVAHQAELAIDSWLQELGASPEVVSEVEYTDIEELLQLVFEIERIPSIVQRSMQQLVGKLQSVLTALQPCLDDDDLSELLEAQLNADTSFAESRST